MSFNEDTCGFCSARFIDPPMMMGDELGCFAPERHGQSVGTENPSRYDYAKAFQDDEGDDDHGTIEVFDDGQDPIPGLG